jgi:7-cyano-7-deazaguanine synthase in queuosine biosynthesis
MNTATKLKDQILLFSGGTDSFIAWEYLNRPPALYVDLHTRYSQVELERVKQLASLYNMDLTVDSRLTLGDQELSDGSGFVPHRNTFLLLIASFYANRIWLAGLGSDVVIDKTPEYSLEFSRFLSEQLKHRARSVVVDSPFWNYTKEDTIRWLIQEKGFALAQQMIKKTFSCYTEGNVPCGKCQACFRRYVALAVHQIHEKYEVNPLEGCSRIIEHKYIPQMIASLEGIGPYDLRRSVETLGLIYLNFAHLPLIQENLSLIQEKLRIESTKIEAQFEVIPKYTLDF